jgi:hypothetical protein
MPLAIGIGMSLITTLFLLVNVSYSVILSVPEIQGSNAVAMVSSLRMILGFFYWGCLKILLVFLKFLFIAYDVWEQYEGRGWN